MELKLTVPAEYIGVLKLFAADRDVRYYLNGIALEIGRTESRLIATDGFRMGVFRVLSDQPTVLTPVVHIISNELLTHIKSTSKWAVEITLDLEEDGYAGLPITLSQNGTAFRGRTIDGRFPDWLRVVPRGEMSGVAAQFNPKYIGDLDKATRILKTTGAFGGAAIGHNGDDPALIDLCHPDFVGVLMPWRGDAPKSASAWVFADLRAESPQAIAA